ncbi:hypothetical protein [Streptomyces curacoi]|uniref:Uncharacterized protein n=1 Tax=Streptomyces curacoi TaxID=146536 RepID=A0A117P0H8_9ACTN|nr:hypothetical protein [Streptomyces curacoi]KUM70744.1 hypothetical protein AQI70_28785 [Streptomyces curacoi]
MTTTRMTSYDRSMLRLMNDPRGRSLYATPARRRLAVAAHAALTAAIVGLFAHFFLSRAEAIWSAVVVAVLLLPWMVAQGVINSATRGLLELRAPALDERQLAERDRVLARAHRITTCLLLLAVVGLFVVGDADGDALRTYAVSALVGTLVAHFVMPSWVAGLSAQDEPSEDEAATL